MSDKIKIKVTARALVVQDKRLLLVSNDGSFWYTPGGKLESEESLTDCVRREVHEETGLVVKAKDLIYSFEFINPGEGTHKVELYFKTELEDGTLPENWKDLGGPVTKRQFFTLDEIRADENMMPRFLTDGKWLKETTDDMGVHQGLERRARI
ncbi:MAG: NUDIX hydrolase [Cyanobacteria bacterium P01_G01_bin.67]